MHDFTPVATGLTYYKLLMKAIQVLSFPLLFKIQTLLRRARIGSRGSLGTNRGPGAMHSMSLAVQV